MFSVSMWITFSFYIIFIGVQSVTLLIPLTRCIHFNAFHTQKYKSWLHWLAIHGRIQKWRELFGNLGHFVHISVNAFFILSETEDCQLLNETCILPTKGVFWITKCCCFFFFFLYVHSFQWLSMSQNNFSTMTLSAFWFTRNLVINEWCNFLYIVYYMYLKSWWRLCILSMDKMHLIHDCVQNKKKSAVFSFLYILCLEIHSVGYIIQVSLYSASFSFTSMVLVVLTKIHKMNVLWLFGASAF